MEIELSKGELEALVASIKDILQCSRNVAVIMVCRMVAEFDKQATEQYGTISKENFDVYVQERIKDGRQR